MLRKYGNVLTAGALAGAVNGFFGAGGGMVLVPLLGRNRFLAEEQVFPGSLAMMIPLCLISLILSGERPAFATALPYLLGSAGGGILAAILGKRLSPLWLHRILGCLILLGGVRMLWT